MMKTDPAPSPVKPPSHLASPDVSLTLMGPPRFKSSSSFLEQWSNQSAMTVGDAPTYRVETLAIRLRVK